MTEEKTCFCGPQADGELPTANLAGYCLRCGRRRKTLQEELTEAQTVAKTIGGAEHKVPPGLEAIGKAAPHEDVIRVLERALEAAKAGDLRDVGIVGLAGPDVYSDWSTDDRALFVGLLQWLCGKMIMGTPQDVNELFGGE